MRLFECPPLRERKERSGHSTVQICGAVKLVLLIFLGAELTGGNPNTAYTSTHIIFRLSAILSKFINACLINVKLVFTVF